MVKYHINDKFKYLEKEILNIPQIFSAETDIIGDKRNVIKIIDVGGVKCVVKMFKHPHIINQFAYAYVRKSKAERSFNNAYILESKNIHSPEPVAYIIFSNILGVTLSYYISVQLDYDFCFRKLMQNPPNDIKDILIAFTRFTYEMQEKEVFFKDHSPGNTLMIRNDKGGIDFYLVDLNRIDYRKMGLKERILNFSRLGLEGEYLDVVVTEFARLIGKDVSFVADILRKS